MGLLCGHSLPEGRMTTPSAPQVNSMALHQRLKLHVFRPKRCTVWGAASQRSGSGRPSSGAAAPRPRPSGPKPPQKPIEDDEDVQVPEMGWLWSVGKKTSTTSADGTSQPSAQMTVADLRKDRIKAKKSLGQNFLTDDGILRDIIAAAGIKPGEPVLEVGPGTGNLTKHLVAAGALVTAIEKDDTLYKRLQEQYETVDNLELINRDVLEVDMPALLQGLLDKHAARRAAPASPTSSSSSLTAADGSPAAVQPSPAASPAAKPVKIKVVANLPYNITTDFLKALLPQGDLVSELHIMLQDEAGIRLVRSKPGDKDYRAMSIRVMFYSKPRYRFKISKTKYYPEPGVDGALITFSLIPPQQRLKVPSGQSFVRAVEKGFSERRKMLRNSLQPMYTAEQADGALADAGLRPGARAQDLSLTQWADLYRALHQRVVKDLQDPTEDTGDHTPPQNSSAGAQQAAEQQ